MNGIVDESSLNRIVVYVLGLLLHHLVATDLLRVAAFLPQLKIAVVFVSGFAEMELVEKRPGVAAFEQVNDLAGSIRLEIANFLTEIAGRGNEVDVVFQDYVSEEPETLLSLQKGPRVEKDLGGFWAVEDGKPVDDRTSEEMGIGVVVDFAAGAGHGSRRGAAC